MRCGVPEVQQSIEIGVPVENVFMMIANCPERMSEWWTQFELQERITPAPTVIGSRSQYIYNMVGIKIKGEHEVLKLIPNGYLYVKTLTGIDSAFEFVFEQLAQSQSRLTVRVEYRLPGSVLGRILDKVLVEDTNVSKSESIVRTGIFPGKWNNE
jgi:uncharacterized membrane protein